MQAESLGRFVLRTVLWLPVCLTAWYFAAPYHGQVVGSLARGVIDLVHSGLVDATEREGASIVFVTRIQVPAEGGRVGVLVPDVNPLIYTYGLAFFLALMLGSRARAWALVAGAVALLPFQAWGVGFDFLAQIVRAGPQATARAGLTGGEMEAIALAYQLGSLILPPVVPVLLWAAFNRGFIDRLRATPPHAAAA
ncbi:MAG: exosortase H-associated membrane protein [Betaproteobacteria bacterium]